MPRRHPPVESSSTVSARERVRLADCKKMAFRRAIEARAEERRLQALLDDYAGLMPPALEPAPAAARC